ncbi:MAG: PEP/pyruvate-binding domain-containing protein [Alphaproteobacteria bacterium]
MPRNAQMLLSSTALPGSAGPAELGGKAWNLTRLQELRFDVPRWWVIPSTVFDEAVAPLRDRIAEALSGIDFDQRSSVRSAARQIQSWLRDVPLPAGVRDALDGAFPGDAGGMFAVRSSAIGEDDAVNSCAGIFESFLNVGREEISAAVQRVWASGFSERVLAYRYRKGLPLADISLAVLIQVMVPAITSGVLFTREPNTGDRVCVIAATRGLGEGVTSDTQDAETYRIDWTASRAAVAPGCPGRPDGPATQRLLRNGAVRALRNIGVTVENALGGPQDIEWAIDPAGRPWLLQARPQVFPQAHPDRRIWDNANIIESFPGLTLPLTYSFARELYEATFRGTARAFFPLSGARIERLAIFRHLLGLIEGRVYLNLLNWYAMLSYLRGFETHRRAWNRMFGITQDVAIGKPYLPIADRLACAGRLLLVLLTVPGSGPKFSAWFQRLYRNWRSAEIENADEFALIDHYEDVLARVAARWHLTIRNDFCVMTYYSWLRALCRRWVAADRPALHDELLRGQTGLASVAPYHSLVGLVRGIRQCPERRGLLADARKSGSLDPLKQDPSLAEAVEAHLTAYGDRFAEDLKLENWSPRERPQLLLNDIQALLDNDAANFDLEANARRQRAEAEQQIKTTLRNPIKRMLFRFVLLNTRAAIANRELMRLERTRLYGVIRRVFRRMGTVLETKGALSDGSDVHYLTVREIFDFCRGAAVDSDLRAVIEGRKANYRDYENNVPAARMESDGSPYLSLSVETSGESAAGNGIHGTGCSPGIVRGVARVVHDPANVTLKKGEIIVAHATDPGWIYLLTTCGGLVVERGSVLSHTAIIGRELGIPTVVGVVDATTRIPDNSEIAIDGATGVVSWQ